MWIASCIEEVSEINRPGDRSFVLGWPTTNVVASFPTPELKAEWLLKLSERITEEKLRDEGKALQLKVTPRDVGPNVCPACKMSINNVTQAKDVLLECLMQLHIQEQDARDYQLWVLSGKESSPYPLIGHETPFSIKLNQIRELTRSRSRDDLGKMTSGDLDTVAEDVNSSSSNRCEFFLKQKKTPKKHHQIDTSSSRTQTMKRKEKKSPNIIGTLMRKFRSAQPLVFGLPLADICDENMEPPEPIIKLMIHVYKRGPEISGIMRRGNNAQLGKEIKEKIKSGQEFHIEDHQAPTAASVWKDFLRSIPDGLLSNALHEQWITVTKSEPDETKVEKIKHIVGQMSPQHQHVLKLTICLLQHLAKHSARTSMGPSNLATCIAPSMCRPDIPHAKHGNLDPENMKSSLMEITEVFNPLISSMIIKHQEIFGADILDMFVKYGCEASPSMKLDDGGISPEREEDEEEMDEEEDVDGMMVGEEEMEEDEDGYTTHRSQRQMRHRLQQHQPQRTRDSNSGTDSDSMHSVLSMPDTGMGYRRDDSSIDSLVDREYFPHEHESSPKTNKSHLSPSNLSRDSGLTLSDTQLYEEDLPHDMTGKNYHRSASQFEHSDLETTEGGFYSRSADQRYDRRHNPVAPPRKRITKKGGEEDNQGYQSNVPYRPPFAHSKSTTQLDLPGQRKTGVPMLTHPPFSKRISSDSIGEEVEEPINSLSATDFRNMRMASDIGTLVKSDSGTHLFLGDEMLPTKYNLGHASGRMASRDRYARQSSTTDSTPPVSPHSRYSQSSRDSAITDSTYSMSRESSINSAPQTPDEAPDNGLSWLRDPEPVFHQWDGRLSHSMNVESSLPFSKSTSDLLAVNYDDEDDAHNRLSPGTPTNKFKSPSPKFWDGKSHEAEEIEFSRRPHFSLMVASDEFSSDSSKQQQSVSPPYYRPSLTQQLVKGSPPPNVILKSLQTPAGRRESMPMRASYDSDIVAQVRRSSAEFVENFEPVRSMGSIKPEEYFNVSSVEPVVVSSHDENENLSSSVSKAKLAKYVSSDVDTLATKDKDKLILESKRPDKPPNYHQALQRNFMIKHSIPVDISTDEIEKQTEVSARAKAIYEKSLQRYNEQRSTKPSEGRSSPQGQMKSKRESFPSRNNEPVSKSVEFTSERTYVDQKTNFEESPEFLDMGSISNSLQEDVLFRRDALSKEEVSSDGLFYLGPPSVSRNSSKLSDTGSSSGSSVITVSTLGKHDSFSRRSDISNISNVTFSSVTSSESSDVPTVHSVKNQRRSSLDQRNMAYSRHFRPVEPDHSSQSSGEQTPRRKLSSASQSQEEDVYVTLNNNKDPKEMYLESIKRFEQDPTEDDTMPIPSSSSSFTSPRLPSPSASASQSSSVSHRSHSFSSIPKPKQSPTLPSPTYSSTQHTPLVQNSSLSNQSVHIYRASPVHRSVEVNSSSKTLEPPSSPSSPSLHRSNSDASKHADTLGALGPSSTRNKSPMLSGVGRRSSMEECSSPSLDASKSRQFWEKKSSPLNRSGPKDNFLKAKSYFYHPEDDTSPMASPRAPVSSYTASLSVSLCDVSTLDDKSVGSGYLRSLGPRGQQQLSAPSSSHLRKVSSPPSHPHTNSKPKANPSANPLPDSKSKDLPWSVRDMKSIWEKDTHSSGSPTTNHTSATPPSPSALSQQQHTRIPPPYQNPPPFRRLSDNQRRSTSSNSSVGSNDQGPSNAPRNAKQVPSSRPRSNTNGPQANGLDNLSFTSSSEDGYSSSLDRHSAKSSSSNKDIKKDFSHITYV